MIRLSNGRNVAPDFLALIQCVVEERLPSLSTGAELTLRNICGEDFWGSLEPGEQKTAGWCMVHLVERRMLPIEFAEWKHEYPKHYRLS